MAGYFATVGGLVVLMILAVAGMMHASHPRSLADAIADHGLLPRRTAMPAAVLVLSAELCLGLAGLWELARTPSGPERTGLPLIGAGAIYAMFTLYGYLLVRRGAQTPCGCSRDKHRASGWTVVRSGLLAGSAVLAFVFADRVLSLDAGFYRWAVSILSAIAMSLLVWALPAALAVSPEEQSNRLSLAHGGGA